jgi:manganese transport protein
MNKYLEIFLGVLTAVGGFVEIGEMVFTINAGSKFGYSLLWVGLLGTIGIIVYGEMAGRIVAVAEQPVFYLIRQRMGYAAGLGTLIAANVVNLLTCAAEIGGTALVLKMAFGGSYMLYALLALAILLLVVWFLAFEWIERVYGLFGLAMLVFIATAVYLHPDWSMVAKNFIPNIPPVESKGDYYLYAYFVVAIFSSIMLPYEVYFYSSGAIEDKWGPSEITMNRVIVILGFGLGALLSFSLVIIGAQYFGPLSIEPQLPGTVALAPAALFGKWGLILALLGMFFAFGGAAIETSLSGAYNIAQFMGWHWGKFSVPAKASRFHLSWIVIFVLATLIILTGVDPISVVEYSIIFSVVILPLTYFPVLLVARDEDCMGPNKNGKLADILGWIFLVLVTLAAIAAIPLLIITKGGQ